MTFDQERFDKNIREYAQNILRDVEKNRKAERRRILHQNIKSVLDESTQDGTEDITHQLAQALLISEYWNGREINTNHDRELHERDLEIIDQALARYSLTLIQ